jgi:hypothetical protein
MRKRFVAAAFLFAALATATVFAIVWGVLDGSSHPNVGAIVYQVTGDPQIYPAASGTLISNRVFLTAGHVTRSLERMISGGVTTIDEIYICFDSTDTLLTGANLRPITSIITHQNFRFYKEDYYDVGLIVLRDMVTDITPAQLATPGLLNELKAAHELRSGPRGTRFVCVGYGSFLDFPPPRIVWENKDRYMAESGYLGLKKHWLVMTQNGPSGYGGTGYGDSGGPTFWRDGSANEILVAITSKGDPNLVATGIAYRVDTPDIVAWIQGAICGVNASN